MNNSLQIAYHVFNALSIPITHFNFNKLIFCIEYFYIGMYNEYLTTDVYYATESGIKTLLIEKRFGWLKEKPIKKIFYYSDIVDLNKKTKNFINIFIKNYENIIEKNAYLLYYLYEIPWLVFWKRKEVGYFMENIVNKKALFYCYERSLISKKETLKLFKTFDLKIRENIFEDKNV